MLLPQPLQVFSIRVLRLYFPTLEPWVVWSVSLPSRSFQFICTGMWDCLVCNPPPHWVRQLPPRPPRSSSRLPTSPLCLAACLHPSYGMNISSLIPWLLDFHTAQFSVSSGCFKICCCPSFGGARRHSVSTYTSILAGSSESGKDFN